MSSNNNIILLSVLLGLIFSACKGDGSTTSHNQSVEMTDQVPSSFMMFYDQFHRDSSFQMNHISFPLPHQGDQTPWDKETWFLHKPFNNLGDEYLRSFANFEGIISERIIHKSGLFEMNRRFAELNGAWHLIYYTVKQEQGDWKKDTLH